MITPHRELCQWQDPSEVAKELINVYGESGLVWLDSDGSSTGRWVVLGVNPIEQICCKGLRNEISSTNPFECLREIKSGHWTGWLSYEAGHWIEPKNPWKDSEMATLWIARHDPVLKFDLLKQQLWIEGSSRSNTINLAKLIEGFQKKPLSLKDSSAMNLFKGIDIEEWEWLMKKKEYIEKIELIQNWIQQGDIFQANLSNCCKTIKPKNMLCLNLFMRLRKHCPAPFAGMVIGSGAAQGEAIISTSPERFLKVNPNGSVETRPIKGTRPRHPNPEKDADLAAELITSTKDRAENVMIVDLLRNDLGKVCKPGTIQVSQLLGLESFSQVHHLTSVIEGSLQKNKNWVDILEACWPGGSITGAPKLRACERLNQLEKIARGPYCGSFLHLDWNGGFDSNILIRSLIVNQSNLRIHAGCGIVADSNPIQEAEELSWKIMPLLNALR